MTLRDEFAAFLVTSGATPLSKDEMPVLHAFELWLSNHKNIPAAPEPEAVRDAIGTLRQVQELLSKLHLSAYYGGLPANVAYTIANLESSTPTPSAGNSNTTSEQVGEP